MEARAAPLNLEHAMNNQGSALTRGKEENLGFEQGTGRIGSKSIRWHSAASERLLYRSHLAKTLLTEEAREPVVLVASQSRGTVPRKFRNLCIAKRATRAGRPFYSALT